MTCYLGGPHFPDSVCVSGVWGEVWKMVIGVVSESVFAGYLKVACDQVLGSPIILPSSRHLVPFTHPLA